MPTEAAKVRAEGIRRGEFGEPKPAAKTSSGRGVKENETMDMPIMGL